MNDIGLAFSAPFKDPDWAAKFLIGGIIVLLCLTGLGFFVLAGYYVELTQRVMRREQYPLPAWSDLGIKFIVGVKYVVVLFLYALPILLLALPLAVLMGLAAINESSGSMAVVASIYMFGFALIAVPYGILVSLLSPIIAFRFAAKGSIADALDIGAVFRAFKSNWEASVVVALLVIGVHSLAGLGIFGLIVGVLFTIFYAYLVSAYLYGLLYCDYQKKGGEVLV